MMLKSNDEFVFGTHRIPTRVPTTYYMYVGYMIAKSLVCKNSGVSCGSDILLNPMPIKRIYQFF